MNEIEAEARTWLGTPFHHQGRLKGVGVDCAGVVIGVADSLGLIPDFTDFTDYARDPDGTMSLILDLHMDRIPRVHMRAGDVLHVAWSRLPQHVGILTGKGTLIHAYGKAGCVESTLSGSLLRGIRQVYRFKL